MNSLIFNCVLVGGFSVYTVNITLQLLLFPDDHVLGKSSFLSLDTSFSADTLPTYVVEVLVNCRHSAIL